MNKAEMAAIWWRVSTDDQLELSPETQRAACMANALRDGSQVPEDYILGTDWHSLSVWDSPPMKQLRELIRTRAIQAVYVYHPHRLPSKPAHRMMFRALCEEYGVSVRCANGQLPDGEFGEVMEFLDSWSKEKHVLQTQQSSRDGLRSRVVEKHLPANGHIAYGYCFRYELKEGKKVPVAIDPDGARYFVVERIFREALKGTPLRTICRALVDDGIPSPGGSRSWAPSTVLRILKNPVYAGRYHANRTERVKGATRDGLPSRREKNSEHKRPREEWIPLEDFPVTAPVVTWEQWEALQDRLKDNKKWSLRNAHHIYLLAGMIVCGNCGWKLISAQRVGRDNHQYRCQKRMRQSIGVEKCATYPVNGRKADQVVWENIYAFLTDPETFWREVQRRQGANTDQEGDIRRTIQTLERKARNVIDMETELVLKNVKGELSDEAFNRANAMLRAERAHYEEEIQRQLAALDTHVQLRESLDMLIVIRDRIADKLDSATPADQRWVLQALETRVVVKETVLEISIGCGPDSKTGVYVAATEVA